MGLKLLTNMDAQTCVKLAWRTAQDQGYALTPLSDCTKRFTASKGNIVIGMLAGSLAPRCVFEVVVESYPDANELVLEMNSPWLSSGLGGVRKIRRQADEFLGRGRLRHRKRGGEGDRAQGILIKEKVNLVPRLCLGTHCREAQPRRHSPLRGAIPAGRGGAWERGFGESP